MPDPFGSGGSMNTPSGSRMMMSLCTLLVRRKGRLCVSFFVLPPLFGCKGARLSSGVGFGASSTGSLAC